MLIDAKGKYGKFLKLGVQTNKGNTQAEALRMAIAWRQPKAKSFTIIRFQHTNYNGETVEEETGFADIWVNYFTTQKEGEIKLDNPI